MKAVRFIERSTDRKLSPVEHVPSPHGHRDSPKALPPYCSSTYVSIEATCPESCPFKRGACYVRAGFTGGMSRDMDRAAERLSGDAVAMIEAEQIKAAFGGGAIPQDGARGGRDLRLHVGGDTPSSKAARWLAVAAADWKLRGGGAVWTYTHRWRSIARHMFGSIRVLASVESIADAKLALARGYAPALTVERFDSDRAQVIEGVRIVPCPAETRGLTCVECRLCIDRDLAKLGVAVAFAAHGKSKAKVRLNVLKVAA